MAVYTIELDTLIKSGYDIGLTDYPLLAILTLRTRKRGFVMLLIRKSLHTTDSMKFAVFRLTGSSIS